MGSRCSASAPCPVDYACVYASDGTTQCMAGCTVNETACTDGSACLPINPGPTHVCYVGGSVPIGEACTSLGECVRGGICLLNPGSTTTGTCWIACNLDGTVGCGSGVTCTATTDGMAGFCPMP